MTATSLDFSQLPELARHAVVAADLMEVAGPLGIDALLIGAFARDLQLRKRHGIEPARQTLDIDFAVAVPDWTSFQNLTEGLVKLGTFKPALPNMHRLVHENGLPLDLVPFGAVETADRRVQWPRSEVVMNVFGFREAQASAIDVLLPGDVHTKVVSIPALALMKVICWDDRHDRTHGKDASDLDLILRTYLEAGNESRLWDDFVEWTHADDFDFDLAGPRMLGHDIRRILDEAGIGLLRAILSRQTDPRVPSRLPNEMDRLRPDRARARLEALTLGLSENSPRG